MPQLFHIFMLVIALTGKTPIILESKLTFATEADCKAQLQSVMQNFQHELDTATDPTVKGLYAVADAICSTEADMQKTSYPKPGTI